MFGTLCRGLLHGEGYKTKLSDSYVPLSPGLASHTALVTEVRAVLSKGFFLEGKDDPSQKVLASAPLSEAAVAWGLIV